MERKVIEGRRESLATVTLTPSQKQKLKKRAKQEGVCPSGGIRGRRGERKGGRRERTREADEGGTDGLVSRLAVFKTLLGY